MGGTDERGLNTCITELLANSVEQHLEGKCSSLAVTLHEDGSVTVKDDGPGISIALTPELNLPFLQMAFTCLNYRRDPTLRLRQRTMGSAGVGAKCVNAVSEWMQINTAPGGEAYDIAFACGKATEGLRKLGHAGKGTTIRFKPDPEIFQTLSFDRDFLAVTLEHIAMLHPG